MIEGLPAGMRLEVHVMNGDKYKELCPENSQLLTHSQLRLCIITHHQRALLRRDGQGDDQLRCFLQLDVRLDVLYLLLSLSLSQQHLFQQLMLCIITYHYQSTLLQGMA